MNAPAPLIKVVEVAKQLSISRATVHSLIDSGELSIVRTSSRRKKKRVHVRITRESLEKFIEKSTGLRTIRRL